MQVVQYFEADIVETKELYSFYELIKEVTAVATAPNHKKDVLNY